MRHNRRPSPTELLTAHFYDWERRGRGWCLYDAPVSLEPPYKPFWRHSGIISAAQPTDDGRVETLGSAVTSFFKGLIGGNKVSGVSTDWEEDEPAVRYAKHDNRVAELSVVLPVDAEVSREAAEQLLVSLSGSPSPVSFEVIGTAESISIQLTCHEDQIAPVREQITAYFPEAIVEERNAVLQRAWEGAGWNQVIIDFGLSNEFMRPLRSFRNFGVDPLIAVAGALSDIKLGEVGILQVLFQACRGAWSPCIMRAVTDGAGGSFFADAPDMVSLAKEKTSRPLCAAVIRVAARCGTEERTAALARSLVRAVDQLANPPSNDLIPLSNDAYDEQAHEEDLLSRTSHRGGMLLSTNELVSLVHLPSASVRVPQLERKRRKSKAAPSSVVGHELVLGENRHAGKTVTVTLSEDQRSRHVYVLGASGTGKSTLLLNMIVQDIQNGRGIGVLDPHGDLIDAVLAHIPEGRYADVILFDPSDEECPIGFNVLSAHSELEKTLLASDLVGIFRRFSTSFGDQMQAVLSNAILAILESERGGTLFDLRRLLTEKEFRAEYLRTVSDSEVRYFFEREFPLLRGTPQASILTRLNTFLRPKPIRRMVAQRQGLDVAGIMNGGEILLAKLSQGLVGEENSHLLGALLVSKFHQMAMGRQVIEATGRRPFSLYVDEFHNFVTPSMASILAAARKYRLELVLAHQEMHQLADQDTGLASAVLTNPGTRICFRVGDQDAKKLAEGFTSFNSADLQSLGVGEAICRVERAEYDFVLTTAPPPIHDAKLAEVRRAELVRRSCAYYARPVAETETLLVAARTDVALVEEPTEALKPHRDAARSEVEPIRAQEPAPTNTARLGDTAPATAPKKARLEVVSPPTFGRGGREHKYLQHLVKRLAEDRGYRAVIEQPILAGAGSVDVSLEKGARRIACEVSISTEADHEIDNIQKCLAGGYEMVVCLSSEPKTLRRLKERAAAILEPTTQAHVRFLQPEEMVLLLDELAAGEARGEATVRGYRVKRRYQAVSSEDAELRKHAIAQVLGGRAKDRRY